MNSIKDKVLGMPIADVATFVDQEAQENAVHETRFVEDILVGQVVRQGDIYIHSVKADHQRGKFTINRQLAIGNTSGSRHLAQDPARVFEGVKLPEWCAANTFLGPLVVSDERFLITHPEHAHISLPAGTYQVTHQLDARTLQRVAD